MKKPNRAPAGQIRIIGGQWRGRKLPVPDSPGLRPTTDRVRETLFNWLAPSMVDAHCLDCFAGSGALGLEALSRYAASATLLEMERGVAQTLQQNLATLKASNAKVVNTNTLSFLAQKGTPHNVVFVDPPFRKGLLEETLSLLEQNGWLADDALFTLKAKSKTVYRRFPLTGICTVKKWQDRSPTVFITVRHKEDPMPVLINLGRLLMLGVWAFLFSTWCTRSRAR
jgi:16S rRNA (guanine966-N2)-methyltransferase